MPMDQIMEEILKIKENFTLDSLCQILQEKGVSDKEKVEEAVERLFDQGKLTFCGTGHKEAPIWRVK